MRIRFFILASVLGLATVLWVSDRIWMTGGKARESRREFARLHREYRDLNQIIEANTDLMEVMKATQEEFDSLRFVIPKREAYVNVLESVREIAARQNVEIITLSPIREDSYPAIKNWLKVSQKYVERYSLQVRLSGKFINIGAFLEELMGMSAMVNIGRISMETELESEGTLACEIVLYTYNLVDGGQA